MVLALLIAVPALGGLLAWPLGRWNTTWTRWISLGALAVDSALVISLWGQGSGQPGTALQRPWFVELKLTWIPQFGISFHLAVDGLSLLLVALACFLGITAVLASWSEVQGRVGLFHLNLLWMLAGIIGVFLALDLFLFYFFWELMLVPAYFLFLWGSEGRIRAGIKFFIFTQVAGLLMLLAILALYFLHGQSSGVYTFDYAQLLGTPMAAPTATWLMLGFFVAFAVKLGVVPFHTWLPDAYTESPTAATVIISGVMAKTAGYALIRFLVPLFPDAALGFAPIAMALAVLGILYGAVLAFAQSDLKRMMAYSSVSHMGFILLGVFAWNQLALEGAVVLMIAHGITTGALFVLIGQIQERTGTRDMGRMGGLWSAIPGMGGVMLLFALVSLGLPGLGNFVGEFLVLVGSYRTSVPATVAGAAGIVFAAVYALWMIQRVFHGPDTEGRQLPDLSKREAATMAAMVVAIVWLGLFPQPVLDTAGGALDTIQRYAAATRVDTSCTPCDLTHSLAALEA